MIPKYDDVVAFYICFFSSKSIKLDKTRNNDKKKKKKCGDGEAGKTKGEKSRSSTANKQTKNPSQIFCKHI